MAKEKTIKIPKRYTFIVKKNDNILPGNRADCGKWRADNILKFVEFLDKNFPDWVWIKVYSNNPEKTKIAKGVEMAYYNKNNRPLMAFI